MVHELARLIKERLACPSDTMWPGAMGLVAPGQAEE